jgi:hypothetical protein
MNPPDSNKPRLGGRNRNRLILLTSLAATLAIVVAVIILVRPPKYRYELPGAWGDACLGDPAVITDVFSAGPFSKAGITHDRYSDNRWYQCSWEWNLEGVGGWRQFVDLRIDVLDGDEHDDYDVMIETIESESTFTQLRVDEIKGFESGYCTSTVGLDDFDCEAVDSNLQVSLRINGGGNGEIGESGIAVEDYLSEVGAYIQEQLAR